MDITITSPLLANLLEDVILSKHQTHFRIQMILYAFCKLCFIWTLLTLLRVCRVFFSHSTEYNAILQDSLTAEHILNSWPGDEVGRILREYGEEHNWFSLQNKIVKSRSTGGFHSTGDLVHLIRCSTPKVKGKDKYVFSLVTFIYPKIVPNNPYS